VIIGPSDKAIDTFKEEMKRMFAASDLGILTYYLDIEVV
jgi:hypothetical protein